MKQIPSWLVRIISRAEIHQIESTVATAERKTSAEIVPMIVRSSIATDHVPPLVFLVTVLLFWLLTPVLSSFFVMAPVMIWDVFGFGVGFGVGLAAALIVAKHKSISIDYIKRALTSDSDQEVSVLRRAQLEFYQSNIKATEGKTGVLIFVSLLERQAVILADKAISDQLPPETWENAIRDLLEKIKDGHFAVGMCGAIEAVSTRLEVLFPRAEGDLNELPDRLVIKDE